LKTRASWKKLALKYWS